MTAGPQGVATGGATGAPPLVAVFAAHFPPNVGGVELYTYELFRRLARSGRRVRIVTSDVGSDRLRETVEGMEVVRLPSLALMARRLPLPLPSRSLFGALGDLARDPPALVVTNTRFTPISWLGGLVAARHGVPHLHIEHGSGHVPLGSAPGRLISRAIDLTAGRWLLRRASLCAGVSTASAEFARSLGAARTMVLPSGVDLETFAGADRRRWRSRLGLGEAEVAVLYVGRITRDKGVPLLVEAFRPLAGTGRIHLIFAGDGEELNALRAEARALPAVHLLGPVSPDEIPALMAAADLFVNPSIAAEGGPRTVLEAAAASLPIIATPQGISTEIVTTGETGILVPAGDRSALTAALADLCARPDLRSSMGRRARQRVEKRFGWETLAASADATLTGLLEERRQVRPSPGPVP